MALYSGEAQRRPVLLFRRQILKCELRSVFVCSGCRSRNRRLGSFNNRSLCVTVWRPEVHDQGAGQWDSCADSPPGLQAATFSLYPLGGERERGERRWALWCLFSSGPWSCREDAALMTSILVTCKGLTSKCRHAGEGSGFHVWILQDRNIQSIATSHLIFLFNLKEYIYIFSGGKKAHIGYKYWFWLAFDFSKSRKINLEINNKMPLTNSLKRTMLVKAVNLFRESFGDQLLIAFKPIKFSLFF